MCHNDVGVDRVGAKRRFQYTYPRRALSPLFSPFSQYYGVQRTIDGSGGPGNYVYVPINSAFPFALPSNGMGISAAGQAGEGGEMIVGGRGGVALGE